MSWCSRPRAWAPAALLLACTPGRAFAQLGWHETQLWGVAVDSRPAVAAGGLGFFWRDAGRTRIGGVAAFGSDENSNAAVRAEATWHFLLDPGRRSGFGLYGGGGLAVSVVRGDRVRPWVEAMLGAEAGPAAPAGMFVEAGFGGGARLAVGIRLRKQNAPGR